MLLLMLKMIYIYIRIYIYIYIYVCRYDTNFTNSVLNDIWASIRSRAKENDLPVGFSCLNAKQSNSDHKRGIDVNGSKSIRMFMGDKHGRGFDWKFTFYKSHKFETRADALNWARKYLQRQIHQKQKLGRDMTKIEQMLNAHGIAIHDIILNDHIQPPGSSSNGVQAVQKNQ